MVKKDIMESNGIDKWIETPNHDKKKTAFFRAVFFLLSFLIIYISISQFPDMQAISWAAVV